MQVVEQHIIERGDPRFKIIDQEALKSKNLYNAALYVLRQAFIFQGKYISYKKMDKLMQQHEAYKALPAKVSQQVLMQLHHDWDSFFKAKAAYNEDPSRFRGHPALPKYKHKTEGRNLLVYTMQAISGGQTPGGGKKTLQRGIIKPSMLPIEVKTQQDPKHIDQVRIVPRNGFYVVEVVYTKKEQQADVDPKLYAGIDIGVNNLAAITSNKQGFRPVLVNGRPLKSCNQYYNKRRARLQKKLGTTGSTRRMERLTNKRNRRIRQYMHTTSKQIIHLLVKERIGTLVIGKNDGWKQGVNMGKKNNQQFVQIPHAKFIEMLSYKAQLVGIQVILTEESYTSKASFLDRDPLPKYDPDREEEPTFSGKRVKRGLYRASGKRYLNADVNGSYNILRKVAPEIFESVEDVVVHPVRIARTKQTKGMAS